MAFSSSNDVNEPLNSAVAVAIEEFTKSLSASWLSAVAVAGISACMVLTAALVA